MGKPKSKCTFMGLTALCECEDITFYVLPYKNVDFSDDNPFNNGTYCHV